ncbi:MAG: hypothetical protein MR209_01985 [Veillonellaceae bacterium]|nr:hypothetical protein [Veillonellaceae bacterium]
MNKVYKTVWNKTRGVYMVVSELARSHSGNTARSVRRSFLIAGVLAAVGGTAMQAAAAGTFITQEEFAKLAVTEQAKYSALADWDLYCLTAKFTDSTAARFGYLKEQFDYLKKQNANINKSVTAATTHYVSINSEADGNKDNKGATGSSAVAIGAETTATGDFSVALGGWTHATGPKGVALGIASTASASQSMALGTQAAASANDAVAIGTSTVASEFNAIALGAAAKSKQVGGLAAGARAEVASTGYNGIALGANSYVGPKTNTQPGDHSVPGNGLVIDTAVDDQVPSTQGMTEQNAMAIGQHAKAFGYQTTSLGAGAESHDTNTLAVGVAAIAKGHYSVALGKQAKTFAEKAVATGWFASADGLASAAYGERAHALKENSLALGSNARAMDEASVALGSGAMAVGAKDGKAVLSDEAVSAAAGIISVGNPTYKITTGGNETEVKASYRRITNMAGGMDDQDAVNVAQLKVLNKKVDDLDTFNVKCDQ